MGLLPFPIPLSAFWNVAASHCFAENPFLQALIYSFKSNQVKYKPNILQHLPVSLGQYLTKESLETSQFWFDL